jgi:hypothetical protein
MVSLNKKNQIAIDYVTNFINGQWLENNIGGNEYSNIDYSSINRTLYKTYCLQEQDNVCCYCSREIFNNSNTELEHIIPRSVATNEALQSYFNLSNILADNIVLQEDFRLSTERQVTPPFPHHIAYQNIVASCNGITFKSSEDFTCCNRNREDYFIPPYNLITNNIVYLNDGTIYSTIDTTYEEQGIQYESITHLNLNKQTLKNIRRIWFLLASSDVNINQLTQATTIEDYSEIFTLYLRVNPRKVTSDNNLIDSFENETSWKVLMQYKYFLNYFRNNN